MELWHYWCRVAGSLRPAFPRLRTFLWFLAALAGFCVRGDLLGVTSFIRGLGLHEKCYDRLLDMFHCSGLDFKVLRRLWVKTVLTFAGGHAWQVNGRLVVIGDGVKNPKSGKKMPGVKKLHQESESNTKPEYIFGHSLQAISLLLRFGGVFLSIPLGIEIHEGVVFSNRCRKSLLDRLLDMLASLDLNTPAYMVLDAYYGSAKIVRGLLARGDHLVTRMKSNAVAYRKPVAGVNRRGRPKIYGEKVRLSDLFAAADGWESTVTELYGKSEKIECRALRLLWKPTGREMLFVLVRMTNGRACTLMCSDLEAEPLLVIQLYAARFKIEVGFKVAIRVVGSLGYHFWMADMKPITRKGKNQYLHRETREYREAVRRKLKAYHNFMQIGLIAQGIMALLALNKPQLVWQHFASWMRTMNLNGVPSEAVVGQSLRNTLPRFLHDAPESNIWAKFICSHVDTERRKTAA